VEELSRFVEEFLVLIENIFFGGCSEVVLI
jgi:hypothetical protein